MKKCKCVLLMIIALLNLLVIPGLAYHVDDQNAWFDTELLQNDKNEDAFAYHLDELNNIFGPIDYAVDNDNIYVLNSNTNAIFEYCNGKEINKIDINQFGVVPIKLSVDNGVIYLVNNDMSLLVIAPNVKAQVIRLDNEAIDTSLNCFKVIDGKIYVTCSGTTYIYSYDGKTAKQIGTAKGDVLDAHTYYFTELLPDNDKYAFGKKALVWVLNEDGVTQDKIMLESDNFLPGVQYLGKDTEGNFVVKVYELSQKADGTCDVEESIRTIDQSGKAIGIVGLDKQRFNFVDQIKNIDGEVYEFDSSNTCSRVTRLSPKNIPNAVYYSSRLTSSQNVQSPMVNSTNQATNYVITRERVMAHAEYFRTISWTCSAANLLPMTGWTVPRYVTGAGNYSSMPYCWGGFSNYDQFTAGLSAGGRVGNINTSGWYVGNTFGLDCSGYVCRCWGLGTRYGTTQMSSIASTINMSSLSRGDALNSSSHIMLFSYLDGNGTYHVYEETKSNSYDRVVTNTHSLSDFSNYTAIRYNGIGGI